MSLSFGALAYRSSARGLGFARQVSGALVSRSSARGLASARQIFKGSRANKVGLSKELDTLLRNKHDMRTFGLGFLAECASVESYARAISQRYHYYTAMEARFDAATWGAIVAVWPVREAELRRSERLATDLRNLGIDPANALRTPALDAYVRRIQTASDDGLVGHLYCRYFADLFGGSMLGTPTRLALGLKHECTAYALAPRVLADKAPYIEALYEAINAAGEGLTPAQREHVVEEARAAFTHNAELVKERGSATLVLQASAGLAQLIAGYLKHYMLPTQPLSMLGGRIANRRL
jgi:heme oxygenase